MSGPEVDSTILSLLRGPAPCPICKAEAMPPCEHRKRARWAVQGDSGPECGDCGTTIDLRVHHACDRSPGPVEIRIEGFDVVDDFSPHDHGDAFADGERIGRQREAHRVVAWLRQEATGYRVAASRAQHMREIANAIERGEHR